MIEQTIGGFAEGDVVQHTTRGSKGTVHLRPSALVYECGNAFCGHRRDRRRVTSLEVHVRLGARDRGRLFMGFRVFSEPDPVLPG
jgi:hypothetical protein